MIKQRFIFRTLFLSMIAIATAYGSCCEKALLEVKTGYFFFSNSQLRQIYSGGLDVQLCASYPFWNLTNRWVLNGYGAVGYFYKSGRSLNDNQETSFRSVPLSIGLKPVYAINACTNYYFTVGPRYFYIHQHNDSIYVNKNSSAHELGFFINTGFNYEFFERFIVDVFGEYSYGKIHVHGQPTVYTRNIQIGGFTFGGGLGYEF